MARRFTGKGWKLIHKGTLVAVVACVLGIPWAGFADGPGAWGGEVSESAMQELRSEVNYAIVDSICRVQELRLLWFETDNPKVISDLNQDGGPFKNLDPLSLKAAGWKGQEINCFMQAVYGESSEPGPME